MAHTANNTNTAIRKDDLALLREIARQEERSMLAVLTRALRSYAAASAN